MLRQLNVVILLFFVPKFALSVYAMLNIGNEFANAKMLAAVELLDTFTMTLLLFVFRPRRQWPDLFWIGIGEPNARNGNRGRSDPNSAPNLAQVKTTIISNQFIFGRDQNLRAKYDLTGSKNASSFGSTDSFESFGSMGNEDALVILNPCDYTVSDCEPKMSLDF